MQLRTQILICKESIQDCSKTINGVLGRDVVSDGRARDEVGSGRNEDCQTNAYVGTQSWTE